MNNNTLKSKLIDTAISELLCGRWDSINMRSISKKSKIKLDQVLKISNSKEELLDLWSQSINFKILDNISLEELEDATIKDRILELMLCRFDVLSDHKSEMTALVKLARKNAVESVRAFSRIKQSMQYILNLSGAEYQGKIGILKIKILSLIWLVTFKEWYEFKEDDNSVIMSNLDRRLTLAENANNSILNGNR